MNFWERRIRETGVLDRIDELRGELSADEWNDEDVRVTVERTLRALSYIKARIEGADAHLVGVHLATQIRDQILNALNQIRAYRNSPDPAYFNNVDAQLDAALATAAMLLPPRDAARDASAAEIEGYRDLVQTATRDVRTRVEELRSEADEAHNVLSESADALTTRVQALETQLTTVQTRAELVVDEHRSAHSELLATAQSQFDSFREQFESDARAVMDSLSDLQEQARKLVGVIGRTGMTGGYQEYESQERSAADVWRRYAVYFGLAAVVVLVAGFAASLVDPRRDVSDDLASAALTATLLGLSTYAARQSARHRVLATNARNTALELASIGPYLESLDADRRQEVMEAFAFVFFGQRPSADEPSDAVAPANLQAAVDLLKRRRGGGE